MRTSSFEEIDHLIEDTIKSDSFDGAVMYLDYLKTGEYSVSEYDNCLGVFDTLEEAEKFYNEYCKKFA